MILKPGGEFCIIQYPVFLAMFHLVKSNQDCTEAGCLEAIPSLGPPAPLVLTPYLLPLLRNRVDLCLCQKKILARYVWTGLTASISECRSWRQSSDNHRNSWVALSAPPGPPSSLRKCYWCWQWQSWYCHGWLSSGLSSVPSLSLVIEVVCLVDSVAHLLGNA